MNATPTRWLLLLLMFILMVAYGFVYAQIVNFSAAIIALAGLLGCVFQILND